MFGLSDRTAHLFLYLPPENGGLGCPWLTVRADVRYLTSVMKLEYGRSGLGKAVGAELCGGEEEGDDVEKTQDLLKAYGIARLLVRGEAPEPMGRMLMDEDSTEPWLLVADGGLRGNRGGIGMVLARGLKVVEVRGYGMRIHEGNSTAMEWMRSRCSSA